MKATPLLVILALAVGALSGCHKSAHSAAADGDRIIRFIMTDVGFNAEVAPVLKDEVAKQGFELRVLMFNDIIQPNKVVDEGGADANSFQHEPYFDQFVHDHGLKNITRGFYTIFSPSGLYSRKYKSLDQVPDGATFGIPVDPANNGRALFMLQEHGLLKLRPDVTVVHASTKDITDNPHRFKFKEVDQLMLQRALEDVDVGFLFSAFALKAGLDPVKDALAYESASSTPYRGVVAVRRELAGTPKIRALEKAYASDALKELYRKRYGDAIVFLDGFNQRTASVP